MSEGIVSKRVEDVDALYGDGLCKLGDATEVDCGIYSMMGEAVLDWFSSMVRSIMSLASVDFCFLAPTRHLVDFDLHGV